jgi:hypothetical protein
LKSVEIAQADLALHESERETGEVVQQISKPGSQPRTNA